MATRRTSVLARVGAAAGVTGLLAAALVGTGGSASAQNYPIDTPPSPSPSNNVGGIGGGDASASPTGTPTRPATQGPATQSPGGPPSTPPGCLRAAEVMPERDTITAGGSTGLTVTATPNSVVDVFAYTQPSRDYRVVRTTTLGDSGVATYTIKPPANTRLYAQQRGCAFGRSKVVNVRTALSLAVVRDDVRTYTFAGDSLPARKGGLIVNLYRVRPDGGQVLTSQARANEVDGEWTVTRKFTGDGRFGFVVRTGQDVMNSPGTSNVRTVTVF